MAIFVFILILASCKVIKREILSHFSTHIRILKMIKIDTTARVRNLFVCETRTKQCLQLNWYIHAVYTTTRKSTIF